MSSANPVRSKWYDENRVGQDTLYDSCEKVSFLISLFYFSKIQNQIKQVLNILCSDKHHAQPFLQKVSKRDVPDYHDIIKNPMDFGTIQKKVFFFFL